MVLWQQFVLRGGVTLTVLAIGAVVYAVSMNHKNKALHQMQEKLTLLEQEKAAALALQEELLLQIRSQSDPAWVEMLLKQHLGVVREGQEKVCFHDS